MDRSQFARTLISAAALTFGGLILAACGDDPITQGSNDAGANDSGEPPGNSEPTPRCTAPTAVGCVDQQISALQLFQRAEEVSTGAITQESKVGDVFIEAVDGRGGGANPTQSFTYARFTPNGLERLDITDAQAFDSMDWHIAFRRYLVRVNSGISGPSCTEAARVDTTDFDSVTAVPEALSYRSEVYMEAPSCELITDGSGLPGSPALALGSFWTYPGCVAMTGNVFVLRLADGRNAKFQVLNYYPSTVQESCNAGMFTGPSGAAQYRVKWAYLP